MIRFDSLKDLIVLAYKKLKGSVYYDKYQLFLRQKIVDQESPNAEESEFLKKIEDSLLNASNKNAPKFDILKDEILNSISYKILPKSIKDNSEKNVLINAHDNEMIEIEKSQYFIDMSLEGYILGVIWTMFVGLALDCDNQMYEHAYANRLQHDLVFKNTPKLFNPYFEQYVDWRENALNKAKKSLSEQKDVVIITMDLSRYYYSVDMGNDDFKEMYKSFEDHFKDEDIEIGTGGNQSISKEALFEIIAHINELVFNIMQNYSCELRKTEDPDILNTASSNTTTFLPIGFMPSAIISNWKLNKFDKEIVSQLNPVYYGRYVDDILFVDKVEKNSQLYEIMGNNPTEDNNITEKIMEYYFVGYQREECTDTSKKPNNDISLCHKCDNKKDCKKYINRDILKILNKSTNKDLGNNSASTNKNYCICNNLLTGNTTISLQSKKVKTFYFRNKSTSALIDCFKKQIAVNASEFRLLPDLSDIIENDDFSNFFKLINEDGPNKLRGVDKFIFDKYGASKMLGKILKASRLFKDEKEGQFLKEVVSFFDAQLFIENFIMWERLFEILIVNGQYDLFVETYKKIYDIIDRQLQCNLQNTQDNLKNDLKKFLKFSAYRSMSLLCKKEIVKILQEIGQFSENIAEYAQIMSYRTTRMFNKYLVAIPLEFLPVKKNEKISIYKEENEKISICKFDEVMLNINLEDFTSRTKPILPYTITPQDIAFALQCNCIKKAENLINPVELMQKINGYFSKFNGYSKSYEPYSNISIGPYCDSNYCTTIKDSKLKNDGKLKIAIGNATVSLERAKEIMMGSPKVSYRKYSDTIKMINLAVKEKVDILVLPECYLPFEWLSVIANHCAKNKIALVCGLEHYLSPSNKKTNKTVYNLTAIILPYSYDEYNFAYISLHHKCHYAPAEIELINSYSHNYIEGQWYELFQWKGINFPVYCCYELASIKDRAIFANVLDMLIAVEWNKDVNYYSNIIESLTRDLHCYCIQVNSADYGDSRIVQPTITETHNIIKTKGGINQTILVGEIDITKLRNFQKLSIQGQTKDKTFKPTPPGFDKESPYKRDEL